MLCPQGAAYRKTEKAELPFSYFIRMSDLNHEGRVLMTYSSPKGHIPNTAAQELSFVMNFEGDKNIQTITILTKQIQKQNKGRL